ncbi:MAG: 3-oxoacyl-ACP reductase family protein [Planctomycetota bacterium]|nr:3-oxoacyl-ACP reductase family protein [Planctomycetota bacterium]
MFTIDLSGKTALVTGGGQGLGAGMCQTFAEAGANVVVNYFNDPDGLNLTRAAETVDALGGSGTKADAVAIEADVRNAEQIERMIDKTIEHFGSLDILVNNAGILRDKTIKKMTPDEWQAVMDTNLTGVFNTCHAVAERLADGGRIINLASIAAFVGFFGQSNYAAAKAGVVGLTKVLSREMAKRQITVNAVAPGVILTEMGKSIPDEVRDEMFKLIPLARFGEPEEIAQVVLFLASDMASYITGQTVHVNGGWWG